MLSSASLVASALRASLREAAGSTFGPRVPPKLPSRAVPNQLLYHPPHPHEPDVALASRFRKGHYALAGAEVETPEGAAPWDMRPPSRSWFRAMHGFDWLTRFPPEGHVLGHGRWLITSWLEAAGKHPPMAWDGEIVSKRIMSWLQMGKPLIDQADHDWRQHFLASLVAQARYLDAVHRQAPVGTAARVRMAMGLAIAGASLPGCTALLERGLQDLSRELSEQILSDGGHVSRNPSVVLELLEDLTVVRDTMAGISKAMPETVFGAITRMGPMLRFFQHGDDRLGLFNGSYEEDAERITALTERHNPEGKPFGVAPASRYQRLAAGGTVLLVDTGGPPKGAASLEAHASALAFEMSSGRHRIIVNCGSGAGLGSDWEGALRATAAHSTLTVADTSSCRFLTGGLAYRKLGPRIVSPDMRVLSRRNEEERGIWLATSQDGYAEPFGLVHERRFFMATEGNDIRGEDRLLPSGSPEEGFEDVEGLEFAARFHLHPDVRPSLAKDGTSATLRLESGDGWQFRAQGGALTLEESIYCGDPFAPKPTQQLVISGAMAREPAVLKWALTRMPRPGGAPV